MPTRREVLILGGALALPRASVDISLHGLRVATDSSIKPGAHVVVQVLMPEGGCPIDGVLYTVRWIDQGKIGLEACEISAEQQRRLRGRLTSRGQGQESVEKSSSPCMTIEQPIRGIGWHRGGAMATIFPQPSRDQHFSPETPPSPAVEVRTIPPFIHALATKEFLCLWEQRA